MSIHSKQPQLQQTFDSENQSALLSQGKGQLNLDLSNEMATMPESLIKSLKYNILESNFDRLHLMTDG